MSTLRVHLLGDIQISHTEHQAGVRATRAVEALLGYLMLRPSGGSRRQVIAGLFWGDRSEEQARSCLNTTLWRLRSILEPRGVLRQTYILSKPIGEIRFNRDSDYWLDVESFESQVEKVLTLPANAIDAHHAAILKSALEMYTGDLMEGFDNEWILGERERISAMYMRCLAYLMLYHQRQGDHQESIAYGKRILEHDPLREEVHREVMRLYLEIGQRGLAARQYEVCRRNLSQELNVEPMEETITLYSRIVGGMEPTAAPDSFHPDLGSLNQVLQQVQAAMQNLDQGRAELKRYLRRLERYTNGAVR